MITEKIREGNELKCPKCKGEIFLIESTVLKTEHYKIYKNGRVSDHPIKTVFDDEDMAEHDNIFRCKTCNTGYIIPHIGRRDIIGKIDFSTTDLEEVGIESEY